MIGYILAAVIGYLLGSIPFGLLLTQAAGLGDVRKIGSGNIGATNVLRTGNRGLAAATLILDALKGAVAVLIARYLVGGLWVSSFVAAADDPEAARTFTEACVYIAAIAVFLGHCFPVWLRFKGGKGVATMIGVLLGLAWPVGVIFCAVWLFIALTQRYSSLSALTAAVTSPLFAYVAYLMGWADGGVTLAATAALLALILVYNHRANIARLLNGTEPKIGSEKRTAEPS